MSDETDNSEWGINRRTVLKGVGAVSATGYVGVAAGKGGKGNKGGGNGGETGYAGAGPYDPAEEGECSNCYRSQVFTLWAGQDNDAGTVTLSNDEDNIYVTYDTNESADLKEVHVDVYATADAVPDQRPAPGQADYKAENMYTDAYTVTVPFADLDETVGCGDDYYVIAHTALTSDDASDDGEDADSDLSNDGETAYAGGSESALEDGKGAWFYVAEYTIECCCFDISGAVYEDGDGDATFDDGEGGWDGIEVTLEDDAGNVVATTTTDTDGTYTFEDIPGGEDYTVVVKAPDGYVGTENSGSYEITDLDSDLTEVDFGFTEDCGCLLTKYEWDKDEREFVWEKGRGSLGIDGDEFNITVTDTNDDGEPLGFEFDSIDNANGDGIYEATHLKVKAGTDTVIKQYDWASNATYNVDGELAISNFTLCINDAIWQLDFGTNDPPKLNTEDPATREGYGNDRELIRAAVYGPPNRTGNFSYSQSVSGVNVLDTEFDLEDRSGSDVPIGSGDAVTAKLTFEVTADEPLKLHAGVWEMPGPYDKADMPWGPRYDLVEDTFDPGDHTIEVNLPTCLEETATDFTYNVETDFGGQGETDGSGNIKFESTSEPALGEGGVSESDTFTFTAGCKDETLLVETKNQNTVSQSITPGETVTMSNGFDVTWDSLTENDDGTWEYEFTVTSDGDDGTGALSYVAFDTDCAEGSISS